MSGSARSGAPAFAPSSWSRSSTRRAGAPRTTSSSSSARSREDQPAGLVDVARALRGALAMTQNEIRRRAKMRSTSQTCFGGRLENRLVQVS
jgi:hypothetical protein